MSKRKRDASDGAEPTSAVVQSTTACAPARSGMCGREEEEEEEEDAQSVVSDLTDDCRLTRRAYKAPIFTSARRHIETAVGVISNMEDVQPAKGTYSGEHDILKYASWGKLLNPRGKKKSQWWKYYWQWENPTNDPKAKLWPRCRGCGLNICLGSDASPTNLANHAKRCESLKNVLHLSAEATSPRATVVDARTNLVSNSALECDRNIELPLQPKTSQFPDYRLAFKTAVARHVITDYLRFNMPEGKALDQLIKIVIARLYNLSTEFIKDFMDLESVTRVQVMKERLRGVQYSMTHDAWTSTHNVSYIALTLHFIDADWKAQSWTVACCAKDDKSTAEVVVKLVKEALVEYDLSVSNMVGFTADTEATFEAVAQALAPDCTNSAGSDEVIFSSCVAHSFESIVKKAREKSTLSDAVTVVKPLKEILLILDSEKNVTISFLPHIVAIARIKLKRIAEDNALPLTARQLARTVRLDFTGRWGSWAEGTVCGEHEPSESSRSRIRSKGISLAAMWAAALDPRTKSLKAFLDTDRSNIIKGLKAEALRIAQSSPQNEVNSASTVTQSSLLFDTAAQDEFYVAIDINYLQTEPFAGYTLESAVDIEYSNFILEPGLPMPIKGAGAENPNPLMWWRDRERKYPKLAALARRVLAIPASSTSSRSLLIMRQGPAYVDGRAHLSPEIAEQMVLMNEYYEKVM